MGGRTWLAVILCFLVWFGYVKYFAPPPPVAQKQSSDVSKPVETAPSASTSAEQGDVFSKVPALSVDFTKDTPKAQYGFSQEGGKLSQVTLNDYHETVKDSSPLIASLDSKQMTFSLSTLFTSEELEGLNFKPYRREDPTGGPVVLSASTPKGVKVTKVYELSPDSYALKWRFVIQVPQSMAEADLGSVWIPLGGTKLVYDAKEPATAWETVVYQDESLTRTILSDIKPEQMRGNTRWLAFGNRYFATALVNESSINPDVELVSNDNFQGAYLKFPLHLKKGEREISLSFSVYSGPKDLKELAAAPELKQLVDFGMFSIVAYPLLRVLKFFYRYVHNYGIAIILLTILVRALFYPLTAKSMKSMKAMQKLQPHIAALKEKYKDDRDRLNREQMALFKTHKVNPAAGCLPMLIQLPVFIALYQVLANSMELFHQPFFGWIDDLSAKDPYYIYPILMGVAMFLQQKMTPTAGMDPAQQKMMLLMPVIFTFLMVSLPSGLTLYIFVSTLLGIAQQVLTNRTKEPVLATAKSKHSET